MVSNLDSMPWRDKKMVMKNRGRKPIKYREVIK
jgi:hypothetical protein